MLKFDITRNRGTWTMQPPRGTITRNGITLTFVQDVAPCLALYRDHVGGYRLHTGDHARGYRGYASNNGFGTRRKGKLRKTFSVRAWKQGEGRPFVRNTYLTLEGARRALVRVGAELHA